MQGLSAVQSLSAIQACNAIQVCSGITAIPPAVTTPPFTNTYSVDFDGVDDVIDLDNTDLCRTNFSIIVWAKLAANASVQNLFASDLGTGQPATPYFRFYINNYVLTARVGSNASSIIASDTITSGEWYCLAATVSGNGTSSTVKLYVDGNEVDSTTGSHTNIDQTKRTTLGYLFYNISTSTWLWPFEGELDEIGVWNSVLSSDELTFIYNEGVPIDLLTNSGNYSSSSNLVGWWRMGDNDGGTGTTITNQGSASGIDGTLTNGPTFSTDVPVYVFNRYSVDFDGVDDYATIADSDDLSFGNGSTDSAFSISAWVKMDDATKFRVIAKNDTSGGGGMEWSFGFDGLDRLALNLYDGIYFNNRIGVASVAQTASEGQWTHIACTYDGSSSSNGITLYLNGSDITDSSNNQGTYVAMHNYGEAVSIGTDFQSTDFANGKIDEVAIIPSELSAAQVTAIYNSGEPADLTSHSPTLWTRFEEGTGTSITDSSGNGHTATLTNGPTFSTDVPVYVFNRYSVDFDGTDDYLRVAGFDPNAELGTGAFTVNFWINVTTGATESFPYFLMLGPSTGDDYMGIGLTDKSGDDYDLRINNRESASYTQDVIGAREISAGTWYMITLTRSTDTLKGYINGVEKCSLTNSNIQNNDFGSASELRFGNNYGDANNRYFNGKMDETSIYKSALSAGTLLSMYNSGVPTSLTLSNPFLWYRFEEGSGTAITDHGSGGNDGTLTNGPTFTSDVPT